MSWVTAGIAAAGAVKGGLDARENRKRQAKLDNYRRAAIAYSPWTGLGDPGYMSAGNTNTMSGMLGGGMQGAMIGAMGQGAGLWGAEDVAKKKILDEGAKQTVMNQAAQAPASMSPAMNPVASQQVGSIQQMPITGATNVMNTQGAPIATGVSPTGVPLASSLADQVKGMGQAVKSPYAQQDFMKQIFGGTMFGGGQ